MQAAKDTKLHYLKNLFIPFYNENYYLGALR